MFDVDRDYDYGSYINYKRALTCLCIPKELQCAFIKKNSCTRNEEINTAGAGQGHHAAWVWHSPVTPTLAMAAMQPVHAAEPSSCSRCMLGCWGNCWEVAQLHIMQTISSIGCFGYNDHTVISYNMIQLVVVDKMFNCSEWSSFPAKPFIQIIIMLCLSKILAATGNQK